MLYEALCYGNFVFQNEEAEWRFWDILEARPLKTTGLYSSKLRVHVSAARKVPTLLNPVEQYYANEIFGSPLQELYTYKNCKCPLGFIKCTDDSSTDILQLRGGIIIQCYGFFFFKSSLFLAYNELKVKCFEKNNFIYIVTKVESHLQFCSYSEISRPCCRFHTVSDDLDIVIPITHAEEMIT